MQASHGRPNGLITAAAMVELLSERLGLFLTLEEVVHLCTAQPSPPPRSRVANRHLLRGGAAPGLEHALDYRSFARRLLPTRRRAPTPIAPPGEAPSTPGYSGRHAARRQRRHGARPTKQ